MTPSLPRHWDHAALRDVHAFGAAFDVSISRAGENLQVDVVREGKKLTRTVERGKSIDVDLM